MITIRESTPADAAAVADVLRRSIVELCGADHGGRAETLRRWLANKTPEAVAAWCEDADSYCVSAADESGVVCGFGMLYRDGEILLLYVSPDHIDCGVGRGILAALEARARLWGIAELRLDSSATAKPFYERHGYVGADSCGSREDGLLCHAMRKPLGG
ncbi:MAG: GNAT family N-acetyltransferase [Gammaproteobacteria bacterium]